MMIDMREIIAVDTGIVYALEQLFANLVRIKAVLPIGISQLANAKSMAVLLCHAFPATNRFT